MQGCHGLPDTNCLSLFNSLGFSIFTNTVANSHVQTLKVLATGWTLLWRVVTGSPSFPRLLYRSGRIRYAVTYRHFEALPCFPATL